MAINWKRRRHLQGRKQVPETTKPLEPAKCTADLCVRCKARLAASGRMTCKPCRKELIQEELKQVERFRAEANRVLAQAAALEQSASYRGDVPHYREDPTL